MFKIKLQKLKGVTNDGDLPVLKSLDLTLSYKPKLPLISIYFFLICCGCILPMLSISAEAKTISWGIPRSVDGNQPWPGKEFEDIILQNDAFYIGAPDELVIYLTFDCGFENGNMPTILDVLKEYQVPALFFLTGHFMEQHPDLVNRMVDEGHLVGNHTYHHPDLSKVSKEKFNQEMQLLEDKYYEITGLPLVRFLRPPKGRFNQQVLDWAKERNYYTIMWSLAYVDWHVNNQKGENHAYEQLLSRLHPGAIILLHSTSSDNANCLDEFIPKVQADGYEFKSIPYLMTRDLPFPVI